MEPVLLLAVDGGNSKTDAVFLGADGAIRSRRRGPGSGAGPAQAAAVVARLVAAELAEAAPGARVTHCVAALAGLDFEEDATAYTEALTAVLPGAALRVGNDAAALLGAAEGVAVVYGAGFNAVARGPAGLATHPAVGWASGEWGGGAALGREAVGIAFRSSDGRGPRSRLEADVLRATHRSDVVALARGIRDGEVSDAQISALAPLLTRAAAGGDAAALDVVRRAWREVEALALAAARRAWGGRHPPGTPAVLAGGVLDDDFFLRGLTAVLADAGFAPTRLDTDPVLRIADEVRALAREGNRGP